MFQQYQGLIQDKGKKIFQLLEADSQSIFNKDWWYGRVMEWSMKNEEFKTRMFRFVDVLPYLTSSSEVARHLKEYFSENTSSEGNNSELPKVFEMGMGLGSLAPGILAGAVKKNVTQMAKMFIAGENPKEALTVLKKQRKNNIGFTVDLLGEVTLSEKEAASYQTQYSELIEWLAKDAVGWEPNQILDHDHMGDIPRVNVSVKLSTLYSQISIESWSNTILILKERLRPILRSAMKNNVFLNVDMEHYDIKNLTLQVFKDLITEPEFKSYPHFGIVIQAYLRDSLGDVKALTEFARARGSVFSIRLVKGAYWDYETIISEQRGWPCPVYKNKKESDANYEECLDHLLKNHKLIKSAVGSHNVRSISTALVLAEKYGLPVNGFEIQMLYGMADSIKRSLVKMGYRVREYSPVGELIPGMAYLVRRLLENTSNESFLRSKFAENVSAEQLLSSPHENLERTSEFPNQTAGAFNNEPQFNNEPLLDFNDADNRDRLQETITKMQSQTSSCPLVISNKKIQTQNILDSRNPSHPSRLIGKVSLATKKEADMAIEAAKTSHKEWSSTPVEERAQLLEKLADQMRSRRFELIALEVLEVGKAWVEADGDVTEAIDFCTFYAREMRKLATPKRAGHAPGESSVYRYQSRGVCVVIAPWNFPLAILTGMTTAALVAGNTVIMKPAEQSSVIASVLMEMIMKAGFPAGVVSFLPGLGEDVGEYLVSHKDTAMIVFTGSKDVGFHILKQAAVVQPGQKQIKKCIVELGGKNAVIVDSDADLDEAVDGVLYSAFGFQGQKCSACSRVIVLEEIYDRFVNRFVEAAKSIHVGFAENPSTYVGPLIDQDAQTRCLKGISEGQKTATLAFQAEVPSEGYFIPPSIFVDVDPNSNLAQQEFFAPIVAVIKAKNLEQALEFANLSEYGLTGGLYSRSPANIEKVKNEFEVGNLYINRTITGAMVERHPFGGFKHSGIGSKAGGPDYLLQFLEPTVVTENTLRRGFAPKEE